MLKINKKDFNKPYFLTRVYHQAQENVQSAFLEPVFSSAIVRILLDLC